MADLFTLVLNICLASQAVLTTVIFWFTWRKRPDLRDWFFALIVYSISHILLIFKQEAVAFVYIGNGLVVVALLVVIISTFNEYYRLFLKTESDGQVVKKERNFLIVTSAISLVLCLLAGVLLQIFLTLDILVLIVLVMIALLIPITVFVLRIYLKYRTVTRLFMFYTFFIGTITAISTILATYTSWGNPLNYASNFVFITLIMTGGLAAPIEKRVSDSEEKYRELNVHLEEEVSKQTKKLKEAFNELETFSYSVSHDLRAPLRSINGFSDVLYKEHSENLDDVGRDFLERIIKNSTRMNDIINDLLDLSGISKYDEEIFENIDITSLADEILDDLVSQYTDKKFSYKIQEGLILRSDPKLIRIILENLLSNAVKFSVVKSHPEITVATKEEENKTIFCISDNGVGFDMKYYNKLFNVFQRLHSIDEFEGTGIGLATVKRAIQKLQGEIWAEAKIDDGATFYFTINQRK